MTGGFDFNGNGKIDAMDHAMGYAIYNEVTKSENSTDNTQKPVSRKKSFSIGPILIFMAVLAIFIPEVETLLFFALIGIGFVKLLIG